MKKFLIELYVKLYNKIASKKVTYYFIYSERQDKIKYPSYYDLEYPRCKLDNGKKYTEARTIESGYPNYKYCKLVHLGTLDDVIWPKVIYGFEKVEEVIPNYFGTSLSIPVNFGESIFLNNIP